MEPFDILLHYIKLKIRILVHQEHRGDQESSIRIPQVNNVMKLDNQLDQELQVVIGETTHYLLISPEVPAPLGVIGGIIH